ncbi:MAG TPA: hypothetical protein VH372_15945 [Actinospica sp.]|nr:hypothetical protein [Actinospica sp.]
MLETYETAETRGGGGRAGAPGLAGTAGAAAAGPAAFRRALYAGVAAVWLFPFVQLRVAVDSGLFGLATLFCALAAGGIVGQAFLLAERRRTEHGAPVVFAALAARSIAAALAAGSLATVAYRVGQSIPWALLGCMSVFWFAALLLERGHRHGFYLALACCAVLFAVLPYADRLHAPLTGPAPSAYGTAAAAAAAALVAARRRDAWREHLERMRAAEFRELAPGQEPDGPQDEIPAAYLEAMAAAERARAAEVEARRDRLRGTPVTSVVLVGDLILVLLGVRGLAAIGIPVSGNTLSMTLAPTHAGQAFLLCGSICLGFVALALVASRARRSALVTGQICLLLCGVLFSAIVILYLGSGTQSSNPDPGTVATQNAGNGDYCSGGTCYGNAS